MADISTGRQRGIVPFVDETTGRLPDQYLPQGVIDLQGDLEQAVSDASQSATAAKASETSAKSSAESATQSASAAAASAESAQTATESAASSKDAAAQSASAASESAQAAETSKTNAAASASAAETSKTNAAASASAAKVSETNAAASATAAQQAVDGFGLEVGTTTTGEPGTDAAVSITKQGTKYVADFTIPRGEPGPDVSETVDKIVDDFYNESYYYDKNVETIPGYKVIDGYKLSVAGDTTFTIEPDSGNKVMGFPVKEGQTLQLSASTFYNATPAFVWATTTDTPQAWNGSNGLEMLSKTDNDYYLGSTELAWIVKTSEITVPSGAKMIWVYNRESKASIGVKKPSLEMKPINLYARETVFSIQKPEVTAGEVVEQKRYSRYNRPAWMWNFNTAAKISMKNVNVHASDSDKVGLWIYFSQSALTYTDDTDGTCELLVDGIKIGDTIYNAYVFTAGWNYLEIPISDGGDHTVEINFNLVRGDYTIALDTFEVNYIPKVKPQILLSFDDANDILTDNRWTLVNKYGFVATFANPDEVTSGQEGLYEAFSRGWDWALYGGIDSTVSRPDYDNGSVDDWEKYLRTKIERCEEIGLFEPFTYFSPENRGSSVIEQALRNLGFKMARIGGSNTDNITWFDDYNMLYMQTVGVGGSTTSSEVLQKIDDAIGKNSSIVVFTHKVEDSSSSDMNTTVDVYTEILEGIKQRVDKGLCEVSNFTDFFRKWCPESCEQKMRIREIKEHNYIMKKISN